jgi:hypothetical protein
MRLPRMTTRRWMLAVAVVAVLAAGFVWCKRRHDRFAELASSYYRESESLPAFWSGSIEAFEGPQGLPYRRRGYLHLLSVKYEYAARHPWLPVELDPPLPK